MTIWMTLKSYKTTWSQLVKSALTGKTRSSLLPNYRMPCQHITRLDDPSTTLRSKVEIWKSLTPISTCPVIMQEPSYFYATNIARLHYYTLSGVHTFLSSILLLFMARPLIPSLPIHNLWFTSIPVNFFFVIIAVASIFSIMAFLCTSSKTKKSLTLKTSFLSKEKRVFSKLNSNISSKALSMVKMISWRKVAESEGEEEAMIEDDDSDEAVWRKTIIKGERCRPLDFSGKIVYDSQGNLLPDLPQPSSE